MLGVNWLLDVRYWAWSLVVVGCGELGLQCDILVKDYIISKYSQDSRLAGLIRIARIII